MLKVYTFLITLAALATPSLSFANPFVVQVPVDATGASPKSAREKALTRGRRQAFDILLQRLVPADSRSLFSEITDKELETLTLGTAFEGEKNSKTRYLATAYFRFDERALGRFLKEQGISYTNSKVPPQLLIPIFSTPLGTQLWDENNPWFNAWPLGEDIGEEAISIQIPLGDLQDRFLFPVSNARERNISEKNIHDALSRYDAAGLFIAHLKSKDSGAKIVLYHFQPGEGWLKVGHTEFSHQPLEVLLKKAKEEALSLANQWAQTKLQTAQTQENQTLLVPIQSLAQWQTLQRTLKRLPSIEKFQVLSLSTTAVLLEIKPRGQKDFLQRTFAEEGWKITPSANGTTLKLEPISFNTSRPTL